MPANLAGPMADKLCAWASERGLTVGHVRYACERARDWGVGRYQKCWVAWLRNQLRDGWILRGYQGPAGSLPLTGRQPQQLLIVGSPEWRRAQGGR